MQNHLNTSARTWIYSQDGTARPALGIGASIYIHIIVCTQGDARLRPLGSQALLVGEQNAERRETRRLHTTNNDQANVVSKTQDLY